MAKEAECPVCNAYIPIDPGTKPGDQVYCSYCGAQLTIEPDAEEEKEGDEDEYVPLREDWD